MSVSTVDPAAADTCTAASTSATLRPVGPARLNSILCLDDFESAARRHLPASVFGYLAGAAETNRSLRANREAFGQYDFVPRVLVDVSRRDTGVHACSAAATARRSASRRWGWRRCRPTAATWCWHGPPRATTCRW